MQNLSSVAPPPLPGEATEITYDMPTFVPTQSQSQPLRTVGWVMVIGGAVGLALVLIVSNLRSAPAAQQRVLSSPALPAAPQAVQAEETPPTKIEPAHTTKKERRAKRAAAAVPAAEAHATSIRIRARVAPVRATPEPDGKVVCSVKRGAVMRSLQQTPSSKARWFAVQCDKDSIGWVHENFVTPMGP